MRRSAAALLAHLLLAPSAVHAEDANQIAKLLREHRVPAVGVGILREGRLQQVQVFGILREGQPARYDAIFNVASLTKPIFSILVLRLVSAGEWQLDEPLARYWIDPDIAGDPRHAKLTTRHVLSHQTGFPNWRSGKLAFEFDPGTRFQYSGEGFEYLRVALEKKFDKPLAQLSRERLLAPLGMNDTHHAWDEHMDESRFARWHDAAGRNVYTRHKIATVNAADNLLTTIEDYGRFAEAVLRNDGLSPAVAAEMVKAQVEVKDGMHMGLGWEVHTGFPNGEYALIHSGADEGVHAVVILTPKSGQGLIVMTNGDGGFRLYEPLVRNSLDLGNEIMARER